MSCLFRECVLVTVLVMTLVIALLVVCNVKVFGADYKLSVLDFSVWAGSRILTAVESGWIFIFFTLRDTCHLSQAISEEGYSKKLHIL